MQKTLFDRLRINDLIRHARQKATFSIVGSYAEGTKLQIGKFARIETSNIEEWSYADETKTPVSKMGISALKHGDSVVHNPTNINYLVGSIVGDYAYCSYTDVVCDENAAEWHLYAKSNGVRPA